MELKNKILMCMALFGILFLLFTGSASAAVDFPSDEAGISAYVKAKSSINMISVKPALATIERETDDYIIGTVAMSGHSEEQYPHVYVSTDGWVVAYYLRDISSGWLLPWYYYSGGPISTTTLKEVVAEVCTQIGGTTTGLKYYDFRHPNATKMMIIIESTTGTNFFTVTIPTDFTVYRVDWSHWCSVCSEYKKSHRSDVYLDGSSFNTISDCNNCFSCGSFAPSVEFINGIEHKIEITTSKDTPIIGLVIEYEE